MNILVSGLFFMFTWKQGGCFFVPFAPKRKYYSRKPEFWFPKEPPTEEKSRIRSGQETWCHVKNCSLGYVSHQMKMFGSKKNTDIDVLLGVLQTSGSRRDHPTLARRASLVRISGKESCTPDSYSATELQRGLN